MTSDYAEKILKFANNFDPLRNLIIHNQLNGVMKHVKLNGLISRLWTK